jgi:transcriptional regulator with XRE-family HTH domain
MAKTRKIEDSVAVELGKRVRAVRSFVGGSQAVFSNDVGVSRSYLSAVESGTNKPNIEMLLGIAERFPDVNIEWVVTGEGDLLKSQKSALINTRAFDEVITALRSDKSGLRKLGAEYLTYFAALVYNKVSAIKDEALRQQATSDAVELLDVILTDQKIDELLKLFNQSDNTLPKKELGTLIESLRCRVGGYEGMFTGQPFWPGSELENAYVEGRLDNLPKHSSH